MPTLPSAIRPLHIRSAYGVVAIASAAATVAVVIAGDAAWWIAALAFVAPDTALLFGMGRGMARGRLHPRAVPAYNALHTPWGPGALAALAAATGFAAIPVVIALAWISHIAMDRAAGYGLRTPEGFQRG